MKKVLFTTAFFQTFYASWRMIEIKSFENQFNSVILYLIKVFLVFPGSIKYQVEKALSLFN